jgi:hypothetical protein
MATRSDKRQALVDLATQRFGEDKLYANGWRTAWRGDEPVIEVADVGELSIGGDGRLWCRASHAGNVTFAIVADDAVMHPLAIGPTGDPTNN